MTLMMTISGVRGIIGETMTPTLAADLGLAFGSHLGGGTVLVGRDSRPSGPMIHGALIGGLLATGCQGIDLGIVSTPGVAVMMAERGAAGGVVITASHNPIAWNGIKFLMPPGVAPPPLTAASILDRYRQESFALADVDHIGRLQRDDTTHERHVGRVLDILDVEAIRGRGFKVVLDSVNGAGDSRATLLPDLSAIASVFCTVNLLAPLSATPLICLPEVLAMPTLAMLLLNRSRKFGSARSFARKPGVLALATFSANSRCRSFSHDMRVLNA